MFERDLVSEVVKPRDILKNYMSYCESIVNQKKFENTLAYVTPVSLTALC